MKTMKNWFKDELNEYKSLLKNIPALLLAAFCLAVVMMNTLANKTIVSTSWIDIDGGENVGIATQQWVNEQIAAIPQPDLDDYALKSEIPSTTGFITMSEVEAKGYQTAKQVDSAITEALSAIGVAEQGVF